MSGIFDQIINYSPPLIVSGTVNYKGTWNASTNNPTLNSSPAASTKGDYYVVSTAGTQFGITFAIGDWIISNGTAWEKVDLTDAVSSVFGRTGAVVGVSTDYSAVGLTDTAIGAANPSSGAFTSLSSSSTTTLNGTTVPASKTLVVTTDKLSALASTTSSELAGVISDETGSGALVFGTSPTIATPVIAQINDANGNATLRLTGITSATDYLEIKNGIGVGSPLHVLAEGASTNIGVHLQPKGSGLFTISDGTDFNKGIRFRSSSSAASAVTLIDAVSTAGRVITLPDATGTLLYGGGPLGTPSSGTVTNLTGTASININGTVGATTASTGAFTTLSASGTANIGGGTAYGTGATIKPATDDYGLTLLQSNSNSAGWGLKADTSGNLLFTRYGASVFGTPAISIALGGAVSMANGLAVTGALSASGTATIQGMTVGLGGSAVSVNTAIGVSALAANTTGDNNVAVGRRAGLVNTTGTTNTFIGVDTGISCTTGSRNTLLGAGAGGAITTGSRNTFIGTSNGIDGSCGGFVTTGSANSILGNYTGNQGGLDIRTSSNYIVLSDGDGNPRLIINSGGNVGIGVTPSAWDATLKAITIDGTAVFSGQANAEVVRLGSNWYYNSGFKYQTTGSATIYDQASGKHSWYTAASGTAGNAISFAERMTLTSSGNLLIGQTTTGAVNSDSFAIQVSTSSIVQNHVNGTGSGAGYTSFAYNAGVIGSITQTGTTAVLYNTTSDYRRKFNVQDLTGSGTFIDALKPRTFDWDTGDKGVGFIAHEFAEVCPSAVNGEKDAVDEEGKPKYQSMQASSAEVIANLVAELQSVRQRLAALEA